MKGARAYRARTPLAIAAAADLIRSSALPRAAAAARPQNVGSACAAKCNPIIAAATSAIHKSQRAKSWTTGIMSSFPVIARAVMAKRAEEEFWPRIMAR